MGDYLYFWMMKGIAELVLTFIIVAVIVIGYLLLNAPAWIKAHFKSKTQKEGQNERHL